MQNQQPQRGVSAPIDRRNFRFLKFLFRVAPHVFGWLALTLAVAASAGTISGPASVCRGTTNTFSVTSALSGPAYTWSIGSGNSANASIVGDVTNDTVVITVATNGAFDLQCFADDGVTNETVIANILVPGLVEGTPITHQTVCLGSDYTFATTITNTSGFILLWRKDGNIIPGATNASLALTGIQATNAGLYTVEILSSCGGISYSAMLNVLPPATVIAPSNLVLQCFSEVPPPDTNSVFASNAVSVVHLGDEKLTNGCAITLTRTYGGIDSCGATSMCAQVILVQDTQPPVLIAPSNQVVEFGATWSFGTPTVSDNCGDSNVALTVTSTATNPLCGVTYEVTRSWLALDACSNAATCSQTITVQDTTAPVFAGLSNLTNEFGSAWDFVAPTVSDIADGTNLTSR
ncbi:MAG: hypothetical protein RLY20_1981 [Verrucomicrobiota bacterium]|jgi:hypothetical protein